MAGSDQSLVTTEPAQDFRVAHTAHAGIQPCSQAATTSGQRKTPKTGVQQFLPPCQTGSSRNEMVLEAVAGSAIVQYVVDRQLALSGNTRDGYPTR